MRNIKAFYEVNPGQRDEILKKLDDMFGLKPTYIEEYISMRGKEKSGIETVRLSLEKDVIKVMVVIFNESLLVQFNSILGTPTKVKGRRMK